MSCIFQLFLLKFYKFHRIFKIFILFFFLSYKFFYVNFYCFACISILFSTANNNKRIILYLIIMEYIHITHNNSIALIKLPS